ncbi:unnamed protein product [Camellia sinensis]
MSLKLVNSVSLVDMASESEQSGTNQDKQYFRSRSLLLVDFMPMKNATNFCFCTTENDEEKFNFGLCYFEL